MEFEAYLISKRIDSARFSSAEPELWQSWKSEFAQVHPNSFTVQKLNLINPIRRKYQLIVVETPKPPVAQSAKPVAQPIVKMAGEQGSEIQPPAPAKVAPKIPRPGMSKPIVRPAQNVSATATDNAMTNTPAVSGSGMPNDEGASSVLNSAEKPVADASSNRPIHTGEPTTVKPENRTVEPAPPKPEPESPAPTNQSADSATTPPKPAKPVIPRPVIKPKPKPN